MPFDSTPTIDNPLTFSPGKEGLRKLAVLLRMQMPPNFKWNYNAVERLSGCGTIGCAFGLCRHVWPEEFIKEDISEHVFTFQMAKKFHISRNIADLIFNEADTYRKNWNDVMPADVADAIDRYLATGKV